MISYHVINHHGTGNMRPPKHLLHSNDDQIGFSRKHQGKGFIYFNDKNREITNETTIDRLNNIGIPPAWKEVWICKNENGCLQAVGKDERGRKQYIYHPDWALYRNLDKFENLYRFGEDLVKIRTQVWQDLSLKGWPKEKVVAMAIAVLDETYVRIGNKHYCETNHTYGLTTLRRKHMEVNANHLVFKYIAKGGKALTITLANKKLCRLIKQCSELPGHELFHYADEEGTTHTITSHDVNDYLASITGEHYTAKNFRTWGGSVSALEVLPIAQKKVAENPRLKLINVVVKEVSEILCNTLAICRKYYIHPAVLSAIEKNSLQKYQMRAEHSKAYPELDDFEKELMFILSAYYK